MISVPVGTGDISLIKRVCTVWRTWVICVFASQTFLGIVGFQAAHHIVTRIAATMNARKFPVSGTILSAISGQQRNTCNVNNHSRLPYRLLYYIM